MTSTGLELCFSCYSNAAAHLRGGGGEVDPSLVITVEKQTAVWQMRHVFSIQITWYSQGNLPFVYHVYAFLFTVIIVSLIT